MNTNKLSRRRLLGGFLAALTGWLWPSPPRVHAAPRRLATAAVLRPSGHVRVTSYTYDAEGRLTCVTEHPSDRIELPPPCTYLTPGQATTFSYDGCAEQRK